MITCRHGSTFKLCYCLHIALTTRGEPLMTCSGSFPILLSELSRLTPICMFHNNHRNLDYLVFRWPLRPWWPSNSTRSNLISELKSTSSITLASMCIIHLTVILVASEAMVASRLDSMTSEFQFDLRFEVSNLDYPGMCILHLTAILVASRPWHPCLSGL